MPLSTWYRFALAAALAAITIYAQLRDLNHISSLRTAAIGLRPAMHFLETEQTSRHENVLARAAGSPWQYRILPVVLLEGLHRALPNVPLTTLFIALRLAQNFIIFLVFDAFLKRLGVTETFRIAGLGLLAWPFAYANYNAGLSFDTHFDVLAYLVAALLILQNRIGWIVPLAWLAAANRETSLLIPVMLLATGEIPIQRRGGLFGLAFGGQLLILALLFAVLGPQPPVSAENHTPGWSLLRYNAGRSVTWLNLGLTFSVIPLLAATGWRDTPRLLRRWGWLIVPAWVGIHFVMSIVAETRVMLAPYALIVLPAALLALQRPALNRDVTRAPFDGDLPPERGADIRS